MKAFSRISALAAALFAFLIPAVCFADELPYVPEERTGVSVIPVIIALIVIAIIAMIIIKRRKK